MKPHQLKALQSHRTSLRAQLNALQHTVCSQRPTPEYQMREQELEEQLRVVDLQLRKGREEPSVSEHAMLRYIERKYGIDMQELQKEILSDETKAVIREAMPNCRLPIGDGLYIVVRDCVVVTVVRKEEKA